jgi:hypothetical protein
MKASPVTTTGDHTTWLQENIAPVSVFLTTIASIILRVMKKFTVATSAVYIDRNPDNTSDKGTLKFFPTGSLIDIATAYNGTSLVKFVGAKVAGSFVRFGVGTVTPANLVSAMAASITALNINTQLDAAILTLRDEIEDMIVPAMGDTSLQNMLNRVFDLVPTLRATLEMDSTSRIVIVVRQNESSGEIEIYEVPAADAATVVAITDAVSFECVMNSPETAEVQSAVPRMFGE